MNALLTNDCALISALTLPTTSSAVIDLLKSDIRFKKYQKGEYVFISDQEVQHVIGINSGMAKFYYMDHLGNEFTVKILSAGSITGYRHILDNEKFSGFIQVLEETVVCMLSKNMFLKLMQEEITINKCIVTCLSSDIRTAKEVIMNLSLRDVKHRISSVLIKLHKQFSEEGSNEIAADLSREDFAKLVGVARESLSRSLSELVNDNILSIEKKKIKVLDWNRLIKLSKI